MSRSISDFLIIYVKIAITDLLVEAGMEMRFGGDSRFFVFIGSKSKFLLV